MDWRRWGDALWFLAWAVLSSAWCLTAAAQLGPTFDEPVYLEHGIQCWRDFSHAGLIHLGTMPLPIDVQTFPLFLWETWHGTPIHPAADLHAVLPWMRAGNLVFWWLLLCYGWRTGRMLAGAWGGRLAVALLACEPNLLAHAALATTDIAITACLLALLYYFRAGRDSTWPRRLALPALWCGLAILAKASAVVYAPICLAVIELERLIRAGAFAAPTGTRLGHAWQVLRPAWRDGVCIVLGGLTFAVVYCGSDFRPQPAFVEWANGLPEGALANRMIWLSENLCIFSNGLEGIVRQVRHNMRGHGTYLLGEGFARSVWYYFPVLLTIKLTIPVLAAPLVAVTAGRVRALANWACLTALVLLAFSLTFRVQIGIRLVLPLVAIGMVGLSAALVEALRSPRWQWTRPACATAIACGLIWMTTATAMIWPHGLCYINELWGGSTRGYELVSDSNYDWGQGLPELLAWQRQTDADVDVWYFGRDMIAQTSALRDLPLHVLPVQRPGDVVQFVQARYLAVSTTLLYGQATNLPAHQQAAEFLRHCQPAGRTMTFVIFEREELLKARPAAVLNGAHIPQK